MPKTPHDGQTCCGNIQDAKYEARARREARGPPPWIARKAAVGITIGIIAYASYVYIARLCIPMMLKHEGALGSQTTGIVFTAVFCPLLLMISWTYAKVIFTPPGYAKDYISKSPEPKPVPPATIGGPKYEYQSSLPRDKWARRASGEHERAEGRPGQAAPLQNGQSRFRELDDAECEPGFEPGSDAGTLRMSTAAGHSGLGHSGSAHSGYPGLGLGYPGLDPRRLEEEGGGGRGEGGGGGGGGGEGGRSEDVLNLTAARKGLGDPVLIPLKRYCHRDGLVKPHRTHHCRACGTCVLKYDHHCPWVGQCVGARNHKFFLNFVLWAAIFCIWIFASLLVFVVKQGLRPAGAIDIQEVVIIALAGFFTLFTVPLFCTHTWMICRNQTTVESFRLRAMKEAEGAALGVLFACYEVAAKQATRRRWNEQWGRVDQEANIWWLGSSRRNWEAVMGRSVWWWILPIGRSESDGLSYPINPRFDAEGRMLPRSQWPAELR
ncbi:zf-DHHC-domain-containing protein [Athelia psychrophila]|uniref:Palmitoyltransferase n=1 Tax=Athelia psychrophila TaxID=1759441 RepID=A0A166VZD9_9AGAM|nr:zf-DHHC-domain-containing protein [Fibularhizoctonia sp. CBS 109695]